MNFAAVGSILLLIFGFGFVIFFHELGHFLAAKWVGIKVEQFAVGFGHALFAWRKGIGIRVGSTTREYEERGHAYLREHPDFALSPEVANASDEHQLSLAGAALGLGETEYRLNWIPLGGYVKMLGQDDLNPNKTSEDPRSFNRKSIGARMVVVSAGVIMNIILAAIGFMVVFLIGFQVQPAVVGSIAPGSPAQHTTLVNGTPAPLQVGDRILYYDGKYQHDFTKITLNVALSGAGKIPLYVQRVNGQRQHLLVVPKASDFEGNFLALGIGGPEELKAVAPQDAPALNEINGPDSMLPPECMLLKPDDVVTAVNGKPVKVDQYWKFNRALQASNGKPIKLTVKHADGTTGTVSILPQFATPFGGDPLSFAGMIPRTTVAAIEPESPARGKLLPNDIILQISYAHGADPLANPTATDLMDRLNKAGNNGQSVDMKVLRDGKVRDVTGLTPNSKVAPDRYGLHIALGYDGRHAVVAGIEDKTAAAAAGIPTGAEITAIDGHPVKTWFDVKRILEHIKPNTPVKLAANTPTGKQTFKLILEPQAIAQVADYNFTPGPLPFRQYIQPRKTNNPFIAAAWGITETRDFILQFYLTLQRMVQGRVSYKNMMGPIGIFNAGRHFAVKGTDWLLWFLSMISADLAVVNFLPIPIVDGGLFLFLLIEKVQGRPLSAKTQSIAQVIGLAIIVGVFLLVTYNDVTRHLIH